ncbi:MAG: UDP-N-acetylmuramoylalanyl-D-glutamyl-2,6-diaminopimelate--D-alanyl-D-alanyl ligase [Lachnospiraceae bacterium]|jgi:UDP-N-acetylmuramoyl-tripeptide--D-alanyl-D-alanine ligase|nr:UDP-N-acetylmuramoylalanyl-D-glutamyl-2,6-diaminopimelate--D-alanyl-D-alanyl ligase [Lachnospiraceae bacterium]
MDELSIKEIVAAVDGELLCGDENVRITSVSTNSNSIEPGALFVPIVGERVDAHDYIDSAFAHGAIACFTSRHESMRGSQAYIKVKDTIEALQMLGAYYRNRFTLPVVGITGSVGKTTTKEMIAAALATKYNVLKTDGNMNSQIGLPLMMFRIHSEHEIAVIEMGMSEVGEMAKLTLVAKPEVAVMTNIGVSHIGQLKTRENIRKEKLNIINSFGKDSVLFVNGDDNLLNEINETAKGYISNKESNLSSEIYKDKENSHFSANIDISETSRDKLIEAKVVAFGTTPLCDYRAENIRTIEGKTHFTLRNGKDDGEEIILSVLGIHNVNNALAALAVASHYGIPASVSKLGLYDYRPIAMRGQIKEINDIKIIDDSYNASPDSMKGGIQILLEMDGVTRRIAVLADVLELGEISYQCHYEVGAYIAEHKVDEVVTIGTEAAAIAKAIQDKGAQIITNSFTNNQEAITYLKNNLKAGDGVFIKGSRYMRTDEIVKALLEDK